VLTVIIRGNTDVENRDQRAMDRNSQGGGGFNLSGSSAGDFGAKAGNLEFSTRANGDADYDGSSQYSVDRGFSDRISLIVVDCIPNGNLVLHGERNRFVSGEKRKLVISGIVRPRTLTTTIPSNRNMSPTSAFATTAMEWKHDSPNRDGSPRCGTNIVRSEIRPWHVHNYRLKLSAS